MTAKVKLDSYHEHEALDRAHLALEFIGLHLADHPYIEQNEDLNDRVQKIIEDLFQLYQEIGRRSDANSGV